MTRAYSGLGRPRRASSIKTSSLSSSSSSSKTSSPSVPTPPSTYLLPILFAVLPPLGSLFIGSADSWSDALTLCLVGFYLYHLIRVPWEMYAAARARVGRHPDPDTPGLKPSQRLAVQGLRVQERAALALVLLAPALGGLALWLLQQSLISAGAKYLTPGNILLYVLAASVRPLSHILDLLHHRSIRLHAEALYADDDIARLLSQVRRLEAELKDIRMAVVWRSDMEEAREEMDSSMESVARAVRGMNRREEASRKGVHARLDCLELKSRELEECMEIQRLEAARQNVLVRCVTQPGSVFKDMIGGGSGGVRPPSPSPSGSPHRGLLTGDDKA